MVIIRTKLLTRDKGYLFLNFFPSRYKEATLYISEGHLKTYEESKFFSKTTEVGPKESKDDPKVSGYSRRYPEDFPNSQNISK